MIASEKLYAKLGFQNIEEFVLRECLGKGSFAKVEHVQKYTSKKSYALKVFIGDSEDEKQKQTKKSIGPESLHRNVVFCSVCEKHRITKRRDIEPFGKSTCKTLNIRCGFVQYPEVFVCALCDKYRITTLTQKKEILFGKKQLTCTDVGVSCNMVQMPIETQLQLFDFDGKNEIAILRYLSKRTSTEMFTKYEGMVALMEGRFAMLMKKYDQNLALFLRDKLLGMNASLHSHTSSFIDLYPLQLKKQIVFQILSIVDFMHDQGVLHRDLKPENFMVECFSACNVRVVLGDFGLSTLETAPPERGYLLVTSYWRCPEAFFGSLEEKRMRRRVDLWALGCILYEAFTLKENLFSRKVTGPKNLDYYILVSIKSFVQKQITPYILENFRRIGLFEGYLPRPSREKQDKLLSDLALSLDLSKSTQTTLLQFHFSDEPLTWARAYELFVEGTLSSMNYIHNEESQHEDFTALLSEHRRFVHKSRNFEQIFSTEIDMSERNTEFDTFLHKNPELGFVIRNFFALDIVAHPLYQAKDALNFLQTSGFFSS